MEHPIKRLLLFIYYTYYRYYTYYITTATTDTTLTTATTATTDTTLTKATTATTLTTLTTATTISVPRGPTWHHYLRTFHGVIHELLTVSVRILFHDLVSEPVQVTVLFPRSRETQGSYSYTIYRRRF